MTETETPEKLFEDDPVLGRFVAYFPANRLRLLSYALAVLFIVWFVVTVSLWNVEEDTASIITVILIMVATLLVGWWALHLWNREVTLYAKGFSYRRGSQTAYIHYDEVAATRQSGQRVAYFGGLVHRNTLRFSITTRVEEFITLDATYKDLPTLVTKLEAAITHVKFSAAQVHLREGGRISFGDVLSLDGDGVHVHDDVLAWADYAGFNLSEGKFHIQQADSGVWRSLPLTDILNARLLVDLLRARHSMEES